MNDLDYGPHPLHCCKTHGCKHGQPDYPVTGEKTAQFYPCEQCDTDLLELMDQVEKLPPATDEDRARWAEADVKPRPRIERRGPTEEEYKAAHPEVDWDLHEVLYTVVNAGSIIEDGVLITEIGSHWIKPDYEALYEALREMDEFERVLFRTPDADQVVLKAGFFRQIYADHCKLLALQAGGVDTWDGYAQALADWDGDNWYRGVGDE